MYNALSESMEVVMIRANQDEVLSSTDITGLSSRIDVINLEGNHDFTDEARPNLLRVIRGIIIT